MEGHYKTMNKKYWASLDLPYCKAKRFFNDYEEIGEWILKLIPISRKKFEDEELLKPEETRELYPRMTLSEIVENFLHVLKIQDADDSFLCFLKEGEVFEEYMPEKKK